MKAIATTEFYRQVDDWMKRVPNCCEVGCHACCDEPAYADVREVDAMLSLLTDEQRERVRARVKDWLARFSENGFDRTYFPQVFPYRLAKITCPMLEGGKCVAYAGRPFGCRTFVALENPGNCGMPMRRHQKYGVLPAMVANRILLPYALQGMQMDHIGILLARRLIAGQEALRSESWATLEVDKAQPAE